MRDGGAGRGRRDKLEVEGATEPKSALQQCTSEPYQHTE